MNKTLQIGLLGVIAVALIANAYLMMTNDTDAPRPKSSVVANTPSNNNLKAANKRDADLNPNALAAKENEVVNDGPTTQVAFATPSHDFGTIAQDSDNHHTFTFTNTGTEPLIIENAKGSCGCTVPQYPKEPIAPGETGEIEIVYKPGKQKNQQSKTVTITANTEPRNTTLTISANVLES